MKYVESSLLGPLFEEEHEELREELIEAGFDPDEAYEQHLREFHGGIPLARFFGMGELERFLNYVDSYQCANALRELNANVVRALMRKAGARKTLFPIAAMPHGAYLCLDYSYESSPAVVIWNSEVCADTDVVAPAFADFLEMLTEHQS